MRLRTKNATESNSKETSEFHPAGSAWQSKGTFLRALPIMVLPLVGGIFTERADAAALINYTGGTTSSRGDGPFTVGLLFTVNPSATNLTVTKLGVMDVDNSTGAPGSNGFVASPVQVGLWTAAGVQLATLTVASTDTLNADGYRYATLSTPVTLTPGAQYRIGAFVGASHEYFLDGATTAKFTSASTPDFTLNQSVYLNGSFAAPTSDGNAGGITGRWGAANLIAVPEPSAAIALMGGSALLGLLRRRRLV